jgi:putrescine transport system ATP-binding protein
MLDAAPLSAQERARPGQAQIFVDRPWLDPDATPQIVIDGVSKHYGSYQAVDKVDLRIFRGEMFALLGASGCGKTTLLRMLAGFTEPTGGRLLIEGADMSGVPPYARPVNMMFQSYALFPHMTVQRNVEYGLRRLGVSRTEREQRTREALAMVQLESYAHRKPHELSGGQKQRVALARSLVRRPKVLLLDEPLSALDKNLREKTQFELMNIQYQVGITFVFVTHDQEEAMALSTRIAVMDRGRVIQVGTPSEVYEFPRSRRVAEFLGTANIFEGRVVRAGPDGVRVQSDDAGGELVVDDAGRFSEGQKVWVAIRPEKLRVGRVPLEPPLANTLLGTVEELAYLGSRTTYRVRTPSGKLVIAYGQNERRSADPSIDWEDKVCMSWPADAAVLLAS